MSDSPTKKRENDAGICGDIDMRIAADGTWLHCGPPDQWASRWCSYSLDHAQATATSWMTHRGRGARLQVGLYADKVARNLAQSTIRCRA
jgi:hypothetical protein